MATDLDPNTGYPRGYEPKWWRCPECGARFHDSQEQGCENTVWELPPECSEHGEMVPMSNDEVADALEKEARRLREEDDGPGQ